MKDKRVLLLLGIVIVLVGFVGVFLYQCLVFSYSLEDLMNK